MSFSSEVKEELAKQISSARHCQIAEFAAILHFCGKVIQDKNGRSMICLETENAALYRKCFTLLGKTFNINKADFGDETKDLQKIGHYEIQIASYEDVQTVLKAVKIDLEAPFPYGFMGEVNPILLKNACCKRAFLRGVFLCAGSMSDPVKGYHLELVADTQKKAEQIKQILMDFELDAKIVLRKKYYVVYLKEGSNIVDFLNICEAHVSLMNFENLRIVKEMRNSINRRVNCEAANITKTVNAAAKQIEDIKRLRDYCGFENLPDHLRQMAEVRMEYPDASLKELGQYMDPPVGKSGVNHRLRKLSEIAEEYGRE